VVAAILIGAMGLRPGQVARLFVERVFTRETFGFVDITIEPLA